MGRILERQSENAPLPLAARVRIFNEVRTVLINGVISQVHADIILGRGGGETQDCGIR
jgi:hypothetical protein